PKAGGDPRKRLAAIAGLDIELGLAMSGHRFDLLVKLLEMFLDGHGNDPQRLRELARSGDRPAIQRIAHTLKGSAWYVGARGLVETAERILSAAHGGEPTAFEDTQKLADDLEALLAALREALGSEHRQVAKASAG
ncbi:MAG: Hpt domain-containing protein, partial [Rhodocyclaceae bacterium]